MKGPPVNALLLFSYYYAQHNIHSVAKQKDTYLYHTQIYGGVIALFLNEVKCGKASSISFHAILAFCDRFRVPNILETVERARSHNAVTSIDVKSTKKKLSDIFCSPLSHLTLWSDIA